MKLSELAKQLRMDVVRVERDCEVSSIELCSKIGGTAALTFLAKEKFLPDIAVEGVAGVICPPELAEAIPPEKGLLVTDDPKFAFYVLHNHWVDRQPKEQIPTVIGKNASISPEAYIAPYNVVIGDDVVIEPGAVIQEHVTIGDRVWICAGTMIGIRSFSPARYRDQAIMLKDCGRTVIDDDVEICAQCGIAQGILKEDVTYLGKGVKLDNMIHVGHGTQLGARTFVAAGAQIAGNVEIGEDVWIGVNATISNRIRIGDRARVSLGAVVTKHVPAGETVSGNFAIPHKKFLENLKASL